MFLQATDIANRALQHCGQPRLDPTQGFAEVSPRASETAFVYPKLRRSELQTNVWTFATRRAILRAVDGNTMILSPSLWLSTTTYFVGSIVSDQTGYLWISKIPNNLAFQPENSATAWEPYFGPLTVSLWDTTGTTAYYAGELVYTTPGDGTARVYLSLQSANSDNPATATAWDATVTYQKNDTVTYLSVAYMSRIDVNLNQTPTSSPVNWNSGTTYGAAAKVTGSDGAVYSSVAGGNIGHDPISDGGVNWTNTGVLSAWTTVFVSGSGSIKWRQIGGAEFPNGVALSEFTERHIYPIDAGPSTQSATKNVYVLPAGYLREAPSDPKQGASSYLGAPSELTYRDWLYENGMIVTRESNPIMLRFVADVTDVSKMKDMFCEALAARVGLEVCETLTQSSEKLKTITGIYDKWIGIARQRNAIEAGATQDPLDDYLACRL